MVGIATEIDGENVFPDEKMAVESPVADTEESEELVPEEAGLDEEELNPFGDKWEE